MTRRRDTELLRGALGLFLIAGLAGALFRFAAAYGLTLGLDAEGIRHGHSHLMYFGWITPALFVLIARTYAGPYPWRTVIATLILAVVAFVPFTIWGYRSAVIGSARIPLSVIAASANMVAWYGWVAWYRRARRERPNVLWDVAVLFLLAASAGAWLVALALPFGFATPLVKAVLAHAFLDWFAEGWFLFGLLGVAAWRFDVHVPHWAVFMAAAGTAVSFLLGLPSFQTTEIVRAIARAGGLLAGVGVVGLAWPLWRRSRGLWRLALLILAVKASSQVGALMAIGTWWADILPVRVLYLHLHVLGFATLAVVAETLRARLQWAMAVAVGLVLASLVPYTMFWPLPSDPASGIRIAAWLALGPAVVTLIALGSSTLRSTTRHDS